MEMKKSCYFLTLCFLLILPVFLPAQTAAEIEELLNTKAVSYEQAARFVLEAADLSAPRTPSEAFQYAAEQRWLPKKAVGGGEASLQGVSLLVMRSFNFKGGLFYTLFKNPHYAYRELVYQDIIQGRSDPQMAVSGDTLLFIVNRAIARQGNDVDYELNYEYQPLFTGNFDLYDEVSAPTAEQQALVNSITRQLEAKDVADVSVRVTSVGVTISLSNIEFLANSSELPDTEKRKLREIAGILNTIPSRKILVTGHTALAGTEGDRLKTSQERAAEVAAYIISLGIRGAGEVYTQGYGSERPIADNSTPEGMARNRRVEITILENQ